MSNDKPDGEFEKALQLAAGGYGQCLAEPSSPPTLRPAGRLPAGRLPICNHDIHDVLTAARRCDGLAANAAKGGPDRCPDRGLGRYYIDEACEPAGERARAAGQHRSADRGAVMRELGLDRGQDRSQDRGQDRGLCNRDLSRIRREFALKHHPDRVHPSMRALASRRMAIANMLIDEACRTSKASSKL